MDTRYWWHNLLLTEPSRTKFHFPFRKGHGEVSEYVYQLVNAWLGSSVLELGCGTGWLRDAWKITNYVGVDASDFSYPFQGLAREAQIRNNVRCTDVREFLATNATVFDTLVCYESFHEFADAVIKALRHGLVASGGHFILVDARKWWPKRAVIFDSSLIPVFHHTIPSERFDFEAMAHSCLEVVETLENLGVERKRIVDAGRYSIFPELLHDLAVGLSVKNIQKKVGQYRFAQNLDYVILVFECR